MSFLLKVVCLKAAMSCEVRQVHFGHGVLTDSHSRSEVGFLDLAIRSHMCPPPNGPIDEPRYALLPFDGAGGL